MNGAMSPVGANMEASVVMRELGPTVSHTGRRGYREIHGEVVSLALQAHLSAFSTMVSC